MSDPSTGAGRRGLEIFEAPADDALPGEGDAPVDELDPLPHRRPRWPGGLAAGIAILMVLTSAVAIIAATGGLFELGAGLAISAILLSALAVVGGLVAVIGRWGRGWGVAALVVGVALNPVVLLTVLTWLGAW